MPSPSAKRKVWVAFLSIAVLAGVLSTATGRGIVQKDEGFSLSLDRTFLMRRVDKEEKVACDRVEILKEFGREALTRPSTLAKRDFRLVLELNTLSGHPRD